MAQVEEWGVEKLQQDLAGIERKLNYLHISSAERGRLAIKRAKKHEDDMAFNKEVRTRATQRIKILEQEYRRELYQKFKPLLEEEVEKIRATKILSLDPDGAQVPPSPQSPRSPRGGPESPRTMNPSEKMVEHLIRMKKEIFDRRIALEVEKRRIEDWAFDKVCADEARRYKAELKKQREKKAAEAARAPPPLPVSAPAQAQRSASAGRASPFLPSRRTPGARAPPPPTPEARAPRPPPPARVPRGVRRPAARRPPHKRSSVSGAPAPAPRTRPRPAARPRP
eukprot:tig00020616_g12279.t1